MDWPSRKLALEQEQLDWRWTNYWVLVWAAIVLPAGFLTGIALGFALPA